MRYCTFHVDIFGYSLNDVLVCKSASLDYKLEMAKKSKTALQDDNDYNHPVSNFSSVDLFQ